MGTPGSREQPPRLLSSVPVPGAFVPSRYSAAKGRGFSTFFHINPSPDLDPRARPQSAPGWHKSSSSVPRLRGSSEGRPIFAYRALPGAPKNGGSFQRFRYTIQPFEALQQFTFEYEQRERAKWRAGDFKPGGKGQDALRSRLKRRRAELTAELACTLRQDKSSFIKVEPDAQGMLAILFKKPASLNAASELRTYMNRLLIQLPVANEFKLQRDPLRWGVLQGPLVEPVMVYALRPPWVTNDVAGVHRLLAAETHSQSSGAL